MPGALKTLPQTPELSIQSPAIFVFVAGIGTDAVPTGKQSSLIPSLYSISQSLSPDASYFAYWSHDLGLSSLLAWQDLRASANELLTQVQQKLSKFPSKLCPIIFIGHSTGGILVKEALRWWYQSPLHSKTAESCTAGAIFLGTPHTTILPRALNFCRAVSLCFLGQRDFDAGYCAQMIQLCKEFENGVAIPTLSIYELEKSKLSRLNRRSIIVDRELARFGTYNESLWPANCSHKELCLFEVSHHLFEALQKFVLQQIDAKRDHIENFAVKRIPLSIISRPSLQSMASQGPGWFVDSPELQSPSSLPTSVGSTSALRRSSQQPKTTFSFDGPKPNLEYKVPMERDAYQRDEILRALEDVLLQEGTWQVPGTSEDRNRVFALCGGSGLGKSTIASHYVHRHRKRYDAIFWVNAEDVTKLFYDYTKISFLLGLSDETKPHDVVENQRRVRSWLLYQNFQFERQSLKWLIVFDNVSNPNDLQGFWPDRGGGDILITTQRSLAEMNDFSGQFGTEVQPFDPTVALNFLRHLTDGHNLEPDDLIRASEIAEVLGGSPLALVSLSSLMKQGKVDSKFIERYTKRRTSSDSSRSRPDLSGETLEQVANVVHPLLEQLKLESSRCLMDVISFLDPDGIEEYILTKAVPSYGIEGYPGDQKSYVTAKTELIEASLIFGNGEVLVHRLIQDATKLTMDVERFRLVFETTTCILFSLWPTMTVAERHNRRRWGLVDVLLRHVRRLHQLHESKDDLNLSLQASIDFARLLNNAAWCMYERGDYEDAKQLATHARGIGDDLENVNLADEAFDLEDLLSNIYYTLGAIAQITHDHGESLDLHAKLLVYRKKLKFKTGRTGDLLAHAYNEIGNDFMTADEAEIAIGFYQRSIKIYESLDGFKKTMLALPSVNLGLAFWLQGDNDRAHAIVQSALQHQEDALGRDDELTMKTGRLLYAMGNITYSQKKYDLSLTFHERALKQFESTVGPRHNRTCDVQYRLAGHYALKQDYDKAIKTLDLALQVVLYRPLFEREKARVMFKKGTIMKQCGWFSNPAQYQQYFDAAAEVYYKYRGKHKQMDELNESDFDGLVMFWSR